MLINKMPLSEAVSAIAEDASNRFLRLDPETLKRLGDIEGKVICLALWPQGPQKGIDEGTCWYFFPSEGGLQIQSQYDGIADVTISGNPPAFMRIVLGQRAKGAFANGEMQISGDIDLGRRFQDIIKRIDIDWEQVLSRYTGDMLAHQIGRAARKLREWRKQAHATLRQDIRKYLQEEARLLPQPEQIKAFFDAVDKLNTDVDLMAARIQKIGETLL